MTKADRERELERAKMQKLADEYDPPRPWKIEKRELKTDPDWPIVYVVDAKGHVIPHFTTVYLSAMVRRVVEAVNSQGPGTPETYRVLGSLYEHECAFGCDSKWAVNCNCGGKCDKHGK